MPVTESSRNASGLAFSRWFSRAYFPSYDAVKWEQRNIAQRSIEVPAVWSAAAANFVAGEYLHEHESSVRMLVSRVAESIRDWGLAGGYFITAEDGAIFHDELVHLLLMQKASFSAAVWRNVGRDRVEPKAEIRSWHWEPQTNTARFSVTGYRKPQCSDNLPAMEAALTIDQPHLVDVIAHAKPGTRNTVLVTDDFMHAVERNWERNWEFAGQSASERMQKIADAARHGGNVVLQFETTDKRWRTVKSDGPTEAATLAASLNLLKFIAQDGRFDIPAYRHAIAVMTTAMEVLIDNAGYATETIARSTHEERPLALGLANLGALLAGFNLAYDSEAARDFSACLAAILTGQAYLQSAVIAEHCPAQEGGACAAFHANRSPFLNVIRMHTAAVHAIGKSRNSAEAQAASQLDDLLAAAIDCWERALLHGERFGYRNARVTALAAFDGASVMMDCRTEGIDPELHLPAAQVDPMGQLRMMAATQPFLSAAISKGIPLPAMATAEEVAEAYLESWRQGLRAVRIDVENSGRGLSPAEQQEDAAPHALVADAAIAATESLPQSSHLSQSKNAPPRTLRHPLPEERASVTHKFALAGHAGYVTVGLYPNGQPGELFIHMDKEDPTVSGLMDAFATAISLGLQHGVPLKVLCEKFSRTGFESTGNDEPGDAETLIEYIFRWLHLRFLSGQHLEIFKAIPAVSLPDLPAPAANEGGFNFRAAAIAAAAAAAAAKAKESPAPEAADGWPAEDAGNIYRAPETVRSISSGSMGTGNEAAPSCHTCGALMHRSGNLFRCTSCGSSLQA